MHKFCGLARNVMFAMALGASAAPVVAESQTPSKPATFRDCPECPEMVTIPGGSFLMGSSTGDIANANREGAQTAYVQNETPQHVVRVKQFSLSVGEITSGQFDAFVHATGHRPVVPCLVYSRSGNGKFVQSKAEDWRDPTFGPDNNYPAICVTWDDAQAYARWLSRKSGKQYRLPSEAEWEYAARAGSSASRFWGEPLEQACLYANVLDVSARDALKDDQLVVFPCSDGYPRVAPVAQFQSNAFGLHDMIGNVFEWTEDCYNNSYVGAPTDGSTWLNGDCAFRVSRGGSWNFPPWFSRSAYRGRSPSVGRTNFFGFRVARES